MILRSRFRVSVFLIGALLILVTGLLVFVGEKLIEQSSFPPFVVCGFLSLFIFSWIWLVFGELRTKVIKVEIQDEVVLMSNYLGLGSTRIYNFSQFDGFETALLPSRYDTYEYLYLIENGKKVVKISQFYHRNYVDLKNILASKVRNLGQKDFSYIQEIKEIFI